MLEVDIHMKSIMVMIIYLDLINLIMFLIICALIPKATILNQVRDIKTLNILFITLVCIIALAITFIITKGITDTIRSFNKLIAQTAKGNLTVKFDTKRRDEFKELAKGISDIYATYEQI